MIELEKREDVPPICPHCEGEIRKLLMQEISNTFGRRYVYYCPVCRKVIGVSHRKGFWMG